MIVDTSALLAVLLREPEAPAFAERMAAAEEGMRMSAASYLEASLIIDRAADAVRRAMLDQFLEEFGIAIEPVTVEQVRMARHAFREFGKGNHPAALNFGDCLTYALTRAKREPLLFKGNDFSRTDLTPAIATQPTP